MSNSPELNRTKLLVFDLFGTLVDYGVRHRPFLRLLKWSQDAGRRPRADDARRLMTEDGDLRDLVTALDIIAPDWLLEQTQRQLDEELASLVLYPDVVPTLSTLKRQGIALAICSNLASPYGKVIERLLGDYQFILCLSYQVGHIKPEPEIYGAITKLARVTPEECLFVGDTLLADYLGPRKFGMRAYHLVRGIANDSDSIQSLVDVLDKINN
ncbi:MAG: HAD family hydrolase [Marinagarivorans sp.]